LKKKFRILVCPLDWGIGHATRCTAVIRQLQAQGAEVVIAADGRPLNFLREAFPELQSVRFPGYIVRYPEKQSMAVAMLRQTPFLLRSIAREHRELKNLIRQFRIDGVISDNRFGLWNRNVPNVYMTHQIRIKAPGSLKFAEPFLQRVHRSYIDRYDECWIPDLEGETNLSGDLAHSSPRPRNARYVGLLSRFSDSGLKSPSASSSGQPPEMLVMISGPEPQRTLFENLVIAQIRQHPGLPAVLLRGIPGESTYDPKIPGLKIYSHLPDEQIRELILSARSILCRPGYSTLMDLVTLGRGAWLVATPGQTEQEYLSQHLPARLPFQSMSQENFKLDEVLKNPGKMSLPGIFPSGSHLLEQAVAGFLKKCAAS
jgi:predicted glycosyltransferase